MSKKEGNAPYRPRVQSKLDTSNFDQFEERAFEPRSARRDSQGIAPARREEDLVFSDYTFKRFNRGEHSAILNRVGIEEEGQPSQATTSGAANANATSSIGGEQSTTAATIEPAGTQSPRSKGVSPVELFEVRNCRRNSDYRTVVGCLRKTWCPWTTPPSAPLEQIKMAPHAARPASTRRRPLQPMEFAKSDNTNLAAGTRPDYTYPEDPSWTPPPLPASSWRC